MKNKVLMIVMTVMFILPTFAQKTYPGRAPMTHEMTEYWLPQPSIVTPGQAPEMFISAPSDAIVLFDGKDLTKWENSKGEPAEWTVHDGVFTVKKGTGDIRTKQKFNDFQLHLEWCIPVGITGESQLRGNSGVFLQGMYEVQILDNYQNETYVNGQAGSIYKQTPPLVNAMNKPGVWNTYDIIYTAPTFKKDVHRQTLHIPIFADNYQYIFQSHPDLFFQALKLLQQYTDSPRLQPYQFLSAFHPFPSPQ